MNIKVTTHAVSRYIQRFAGNVTPERATSRLQKILQSAKFVRTAPGNAKVYMTHGIYFIVQKHTIITVYRREETPAPAGTLEA